MTRTFVLYQARCERFPIIVAVSICAMCVSYMYNRKQSNQTTCSVVSFYINAHRFDAVFQQNLTPKHTLTLHIRPLRLSDFLDIKGPVSSSI